MAKTFFFSVITTLLFGLPLHAYSLGLATWNLDWLMTPETYAELAPHCHLNGQPKSSERAIPCSPNHPPVPQRQVADYSALAKVASGLNADLVALQEVDGPAAAALVFDAHWQLDCFIARRHPQKVGFAIRKGIAYRCNGDVTALDIDGNSRAGADITLFPNTPQALRVLAVHLKSGCFAGPLWKKGVCNQLRDQVPIIRQWIAARRQAGEAFAVMGDFNRRLEKDAQYSAGDNPAAPTSVFAALNSAAPLIRATQNWPEVPCSSQSPYSQGAIDNILLDSHLLTVPAKTERITYSRALADHYVLSDHCPLVVSW